MAHVYASERLAGRRRRPTTLLLIVGGHAAALAVLLTARMDLPQRIRDLPTVVELIAEPLPPPPDTPPPAPPERQEAPTAVDQPKVLVPLDPLALPPLDRGPPVSEAVPLPPPPDLRPPLPPEPPRAEPVRVAARIATPADRLRPPYPPAKLRAEEEAVLRLRLTIGADGRVSAVEPVGSADPAFLDAARRHLLRHWRFDPAREDGRPVASTTVINLRFELED